jgi:hypothetical protein
VRSLQKRIWGSDYVAEDSDLGDFFYSTPEPAQEAEDVLPEAKATPPGVIIKNVLGEVIDRVEGVWHLTNADLRGRQWQHVDLSGVSLDGSDLSGTNMIGANLSSASLRNCKLVGCEISYANVSDCDFSGSDLSGCLMWRTETYGARFDKIQMDQTSDIPNMKVVMV